MLSSQHLHDVDRLVVGLGDRLAVVLAEAVEGVAALHGDAGRRHVADLDGVVLAGVDGVGEVAADLLRVDVERGHELHVADVVVAELDVHEPGDAALRVGVLVVLDALDQRRGAVADADDGHSYRTHGCSFSGRFYLVVVRVTRGGAARRRSARTASGPRARPTPARAGAARGCSRRPAPGCGRGRPGSRPPAPPAGTGGLPGCAAGSGRRSGRRTRSARRSPRRPRPTDRSRPAARRSAPCPPP